MGNPDMGNPATETITPLAMLNLPKSWEIALGAMIELDIAGHVREGKQ